MKVLLTIICLTLGAELNAQVLTTNRFEFPGYTAEITIDGLDQISRFRITTDDSCNATNVVLLDKASFDDWIGGRKYYGTIQMGSHLSIITEARGTGIGQYFIHEYEIKEQASLLQSIQLYEWTSLWPDMVFTSTMNPTFRFEHNTNDIRNPFIRKAK